MAAPGRLKGERAAHDEREESHCHAAAARRLPNGRKDAAASVPKLNTEWNSGAQPPGYVTRLQKALIALGYYTGSADGYFGSGTEDAVKAYQQARGLQVDGVAGRATLRKINSDAQSGITAASAVID